jgi:hypothetical protein
MPLPTWSIACTMLGAPETVAPFVAHHLSLPVRAVHVFLDRLDADVAALFAQAGPRLQVTVCDDPWWARRRGGRPDKIFLRQYWNTEQARRVSDADWMVHIDSDEFLVPAHDGAPPLAESLGRVPAEIGWARIPNLERVFLAGAARTTVFDGAFRRQIIDEALEKRLYGPDTPFLKNGFSAYVRGKFAIRTKSPLEVRQHEAAFPGTQGRNAPDQIPPFQVLSDQALLHIDGWTALHWTAKLIRRVEAGRAESGHRGRKAQIAYMQQAQDADTRRALFDRLQRLGPRRAAAMRDAGFLRETPFDPRPAIDTIFPGHAMSFAPDAFDARMVAADPAFFARNGLA